MIVDRRELRAGDRPPDRDAAAAAVGRGRLSRSRAAGARRDPRRLARALRAAASEDDRADARPGRRGPRARSACASIRRRRSSPSAAPTARARPARCSRRSRCAAGYRVGALLQAAPGALRGALPHRRRRRVAPTALLPHFAAVEAARGDIALTYFEFTIAGDRRGCSRPAPLDLVDPRGRARRPLRRGQRLRRRLRGHHQHRPRPHRVPRPRPRDASAARRPASCARGRPAIVSDPLPPQSVIDEARAQSAPTCGASGVDFTHRGDRQQWSWAGRGDALQRPGLSGAARRQPAAQRRRRAGGARGAARAAAGQRAGGAQRLRHGRAAGPLPDRRRRSRRWCSTSRTTRTRSPRWRRTSTRWASSRAPTPCSARCATRTSPRSWRSMAPLVDALALHRPADAARGDGRRARRQPAQPLPGLRRRRRSGTPCRRPATPWRGRGRRRPR